MTDSSVAIRHLSLQARNNAWANRRLLDSCGKLTQAELTRKRPCFFGTILATLNHILTVDWYYLDALTEGGRGRSVYPDEDPFATVADLAASQAETDGKLVDFCTGLSESDLGRTVATVREGGAVWQEEIGDLLLHLFQHQIHHRGQVHDMLSDTSVAPPQLDEFFLTMDRANRGDF